MTLMSIENVYILYFSFSPLKIEVTDLFFFKKSEKNSFYWLNFRTGISKDFSPIPFSRKSFLLSFMCVPLLPFYVLFFSLFHFLKRKFEKKIFAI